MNECQGKCPPERGARGNWKRPGLAWPFMGMARMYGTWRVVCQLPLQVLGKWAVTVLPVQPQWAWVGPQAGRTRLVSEQGSQLPIH